MKLFPKSLIILAVILCCLTAFSQREKQAKILFHQGLHLEEVKGELKEAIAVFRQVVERFPDERMVAASALLHIGICYEKMGKREAQETYEQIIQEFADIPEIAGEARTRLQTIKKPVRIIASEGMINRQVWADTSSDPSGSISPDGRYLSFIDWETGDLAVRDLTTGENRSLTKKGSWKTADFALNARWSPDGKDIAYAWFHGPYCDLRITGLNTSDVRILHHDKDVIYIEPGGWSPDGNLISVCLSKSNGAIHTIALISVVDETLTVLKTLDWRRPHIGGFSADGRYIVYDFPQQEGSPKRDIFLLATDGSGEIPLIEHPEEDCVLGWTPDGEWMLFNSDRTGTYDAWMIRVKDGISQGDPELLKSDIGLIIPLGFTKEGSFYYSRASGSRDIYLSNFDPQAQRLVSPPERVSQRFIGTGRSLDWSRDGKYLAYLSVRLFGPRQSHRLILVIRSLETGQERELRPQISYDRGDVPYLRWFPDGSSLLLRGEVQNRLGFFKVDIKTGYVTSFILSKPGKRLRWPSFSPDGKIFYYLSFRMDKSRSIMAKDMDTGKEKELYRVNVPSILTNLAISPDGKKIVFRSGNVETYPILDVLEILPAEGGESIELMRESVLKNKYMFNAPGLVWTPDGSHLLFGRWSSYEEKIIELWKVPASGGKSEKLGVAMFEIDDIRIHPDGKQIGFVGGRIIDEIWMLENFLTRKNKEEK